MLWRLLALAALGAVAAEGRGSRAIMGQPGQQHFMEWALGSGEDKAEEAPQPVADAPVEGWATEERLLPPNTPKDSCRLEGLWRNQHGSELRVGRLGEDGELVGEFRTAVESQFDRALGLTHTVRGRSENGLVTLSVFWKGGESVTTWTGHCHSDCCQDRHKDSLEMTWVLTEASPSCSSHWKSNRFGQDSFGRVSEDGGAGFSQTLAQPRAA